VSDVKAPPREFLSAGTVIGERYEIRRRLGSGGIGDVYKAVDTRLGNRTVALKMLSTTVVAGPLAEEVGGRFMLEAQALSAIRDDHVVSVLNFGFTDAGVPYLVMEFLEGQDLESLLKASGGALSIRQAVDVALDVCGGVYICHNEEIVHRDLKPANIFLERTPRGDRAKVVDFGISKTAASAKLSRPGVAMGTPRYMAPEQRERGQTDKRSDQYSIGLILYRCLTGRLPEKTGGPEAREIRPEIPELLNEAVMRALSRDPEARFPSVYAFGRSLMPLASDQASARWREYYRTPPQPRATERSEPVPISFTKPDGRLDPSTIRVSYDAATRMGPPDEGTTNRGGVAATEVDVAPFAANEGIPQPIPIARGGTAPDRRPASPPRAEPGIVPLAGRLRITPVPGRRDDVAEPKLRPSDSASSAASAPPRGKLGAVLVLLVAAAAGAAAWLYVSQRPIGAPPRETDTPRAVAAPAPPTPAAPASPAPVPGSPSPSNEPEPSSPGVVPRAAAVAPAEPTAGSSRREHHRSHRDSEAAAARERAPDAGVNVRYTGERDPILE
jgi:serine/threonine-protein kinase